MFLKRGDGKIVTVFTDENSDEEQKKVLKSLKDEAIKESSNIDLKDNTKLES